ncbi:hypothetical protein SCUCBS95973_008038 [Sporothrix curviconia]|uniref:Uncharacterized protein n=1 Tax=Sporothrix curviconia TaxID=1260050 RepID=A0ABP0CL06_9PEZI
METAEELRKELEKARRIIEESRASEARALQQAKESKAAEARALQQVKDTEARSMQRVKEAEARALTEQRQRENAEKVVASTDFRTFLSLCHNNLYANLTIQEDPDLSATGMFTNVDSKFYPLCLKPWAEFPSLHDECQTRLETLFKDKRVFPSVAGLHTMNEMLAIDEPLADENDGRLLQFINAESSARRVMFQYLKESKADPFLANNDTDQNEDNNGSEDEGSTAFPIRVYFSNAPHGILLDIPESSDESQHSDTKPAYKPAMLEAQQKDAEARGRSEGNGPPPAKRKSSPVRKFHPDQWFMRVNGDGSIIPVFVVEYKAAHKLRGSTLKQALSDTTCEPQGLFATAIREQIRNKIIQSDKDRVDAEKATARVIAQAFHYMVEFGLCYSQACILGLRNGGSLDRDCPNVQLHPSSEDGCHKLTAVQFCNQLREQLACDLDENCDALDKFGKFGAIGMLFRLTLKGCGYCVTAKGVQRVHASRLEQETMVYNHLQDQCASVCLP